MSTVQARIRRGVPTGPLVGFGCVIGLLALLTVRTGLSAGGWLTGLGCGACVCVLLARSMARNRRALGPADPWTLTRAVLACGAAALTAYSLGGAQVAPTLVVITMMALALDGVDGLVARRTGTASAFGARFDMEVDAFLILVLSVGVASAWGWWVLSMGLARYVYLACGLALPWLRPSPPPRFWAKAVAVIVAVTLTAATSGVLPDPVTRVMLVVSAILLAESFGRSAWDLWSLHAGEPTRPAVRTTTTLALALVWAALVIPDRLDQLGPGVLLRIPVEGLALAALALALPRAGTRILALVAGAGLGVLTILRLLDIGFGVAFNSRFDLLSDAAYARPAVELLSASIGAPGALLVVAGTALLVLAVLTLLPVAMLLLTRVVVHDRRRSMRILALLSTMAVVTSMSGRLLGPAGSVASTATARTVSAHAVQIRDDLRDRGEFARALKQEDSFIVTSDDDLLTRLRGEDVLLVFVESYGRTALTDPGVMAALEAGERRLRGAGFSSRSGLLTSPTFGGRSWLAHVTLQSGLWAANQERHDQIVSLDRLTLASAFRRAGWRTVVDAPALQDAWPQASTFYDFDKVYDRRNVGYAGPGFTWGAMPDQYTLAAFQRLELDRTGRRPVMAQINLVSSHWPWPPQPPLVDWDLVGDGSVYSSTHVDEVAQRGVVASSGAARSAFAATIAYSLDAVTSFIAQLKDRGVVLVVLGDHQPSTLVSGDDRSREVPVSIIAADPEVMRRAADWGWQEGLRPDGESPVWRMDAFRDKFLTAFGDQGSRMLGAHP